MERFAEMNFNESGIILSFSSFKQNLRYPSVLSSSKRVEFSFRKSSTSSFTEVEFPYERMKLIGP